MPHAPSVKADAAAFSTQLQTFAAVIPGYATTLDVSPASVAAQAADAKYFAYVLQCAEIMRRASQQWTAWKKILRDGGAPPASGVPVLPTFPPAVPPVAPGVEPRFRALIGQVKPANGYNLSIGEALGIEGAERVGPDMATVQPSVEAHISGTRVEVKWGWQGMGEFLDLCELQVDRTGGGVFAPLAYDTTPGYVDTALFPPRRRSGRTAPFTAWATTRSACGASR